MTLFSALGFLPRWAKYTLVPDFMRFLWWLVWVRICAVAHLIHRAAVKLGGVFKTDDAEPVENQWAHGLWAINNCSFPTYNSSHRASSDCSSFPLSAGARVDALLEGRRSGRRAFSRAMVLRRYHHRVPPWENARYRWRLLQVHSAKFLLVSSGYVGSCMPVRHARRLTMQLCAMQGEAVGSAQEGGHPQMA